MPGVEGGWGLAAVAACGWVWGSFLNTVVDRTPRRSPPPQGLAPPGWGPLTLLRPARSICLACGSPIPWYANIPIASYLALRGRCGRCGAPIGRRTLVVELFTPAAFAALYLWQGGGLRLHGPWGYLLLSWIVVAVALAAERRRMRWGFLLLGALLLAAVLLAEAMP
ncbi:MAG: prepilin peptidase [Candidatus Lambdaproteobacteria bacterium]|nr:prepilin peptidase [Candidatus Lambdaproteobacteria bacterium]